LRNINVAGSKSGHLALIAPAGLARKKSNRISPNTPMREE
jgi:hypothetical protein